MRNSKKDGKCFMPPPRQGYVFKLKKRCQRTDCNLTNQNKIPMNIFIVPENGRWWLKTQDGKRVGSKYGYLSKRKAEAARWFLINGKEAIQRSYQFKRENSNELKHFRSI